MRTPWLRHKASRMQRRRAGAVLRRGGGGVAGRGLGAFERRMAIVLAIFFGVMPVVAGLAPTGAANIADRFPCERSPCGCRTPEHCWRFCCCNSPELRVAWCLQEQVVPPDYAVLPVGWTPARITAEIERRRDRPVAADGPGRCCVASGPGSCGDNSACCSSGDRKAVPRSCCSQKPTDGETSPVPVGGTPGRCSGEPASTGGAAPMLLVMPDSASRLVPMIDPTDRRGIEVVSEQGDERPLSIEPPPPRLGLAPIVG